MIKINVNSETSVYHLEGSIEHYEASTCKEIFKECLESNTGSSIEVDLSKLESVSSVTLSFLLFGLRLAKTLGSQINYQNIPPVLFNMARVSGIESFLLKKKES